MPDPRPSPRCPACGAARPCGVLPAGLCPRCLCRLGLDGDEGDDPPEPGADADWLEALELPRSGMRPVGPRLGSYRLLRRVGSGGMGVVYEATDERLGRRVAIKAIAPPLVSDPATKRRFLREARAVALLDHPNLFALHDVGEHPEIGLFLVMPFYDGETLARRLARGRMALGEAAAAASQLAAGLAAAHTAGVVHRDLKPGNLLTTKDGTLKILDFGLAKLQADPAATRTGVLAGTWAYMAPEQARGERVDHRADLWSAGVVLYEALTGRLPFPERQPGALPRPGLPRRPEPPRIHPAVDALLVRCLELDPERRPRSASAIADAFSALAPPASVPPGGVPAAETGGPRHRDRTRRLGAAAWLAFALLVLAGLAMQAPTGSDAVPADEIAVAESSGPAGSVLRTADVGLAGLRGSGADAGAPAERRLYGFDDRLFLSVFPVLLLGAAALAWHNLRRGLADRAGALLPVLQFASSKASILLMATLHVRNVPTSTYEALRERAGERRTSISAEAVRLIERGLRTDRLRIEELLTRIEATRPEARPGAPSAAELIRPDRDAR